MGRISDYLRHRLLGDLLAALSGWPRRRREPSAEAAEPRGPEPRGPESHDPEPHDPSERETEPWR